MTKEEKEHKIKLIQLILLVNTEYARRKSFTNIFETLSFGCEMIWWGMELKKVVSTKTI